VLANKVFDIRSSSQILLVFVAAVVIKLVNFAAALLRQTRSPATVECVSKTRRGAPNTRSRLGNPIGPWPASQTEGAAVELSANAIRPVEARTGTSRSSPKWKPRRLPGMTALLLGNQRRPAMPIETDFAFAQGPAAQLVATTDLLGLLRGFVGHHPAQKPQRTWKGAGFNMIWRPNFQNQSGTKDFFLELNFTEETLSFIDITGTGIATFRRKIERPSA